MDFFEAQDRAHARTKLLVFYFGLAVILIVTAIYLAVTAGVYFYHFKANTKVAPELFSGLRLAWTTGLVVPMIALGSIWRITQLRRKGGAGVAEAMGGRRINPSTKRPQERQLMNIVEEMAIASGTPMPAVYLLDDEGGINAFAAGFELNDAVVGVTRGALEQLDRDELQGVIAHEFSHILNGDMGLSTKLSGWIFGIVMLTVLGRGFKALISGGSGSGRRSGGGVYVGGVGRSRGGGGDSKGGAGALILAIIIVAVLITIIGFIGEFFARLIQAAVSRQREYLADASAVQFTRSPKGIGNALRRIGGGGSRVSHPQASEFAHAFFSKALRSEVSFLATHPPLPKRIRRILSNWKGDYLEPRPRPKAKRAKPDKPKPRKHAFGMPAIGPDGQAGGGQFQQMLTAGLFMKCLGTLREQGRAYARQTREKLQEALPQLFEHADQSPIAVLALLYQKEESVASLQRKQLDEHLPDFAAEVPALVDALRPLGRSERLVLLEMMAARLPEALPEPEREEFIACIERLAQADRKVSPFEMACLQIVRRHLQEGSSAEPAKQDAEGIILAACTLATRLAMETELEGARTPGILQSASRQAPYFMNQLGAVEATDYEAMEKAFAVLARTPFGIRRQFLGICERIIAADEMASQNEVELLRAIAMGIGVPAAPIFPEAPA